MNLIPGKVYVSEDIAMHWSCIFEPKVESNPPRGTLGYWDIKSSYAIINEHDTKDYNSILGHFYRPDQGLSYMGNSRTCKEANTEQEIWLNECKKAGKLVTCPSITTFNYIANDYTNILIAYKINKEPIIWMEWVKPILGVIPGNTRIIVETEKTKSKTTIGVLKKLT